MFHIDIEKPKINPAHFIAILATGAVAMVVNGFALGGVWFNLTNTIDELKKSNVVLTTELTNARKELSDRFDKEAADRKDREKLYQASMDGMNTQIGQIQPLQYQQTRIIEQMAESKNSIVETNKRIDRVVDSFGGKVDTLIDGVNKLTTRVEVISSKIDDAADKRAATEKRQGPFDVPQLKR